MADGEVSSTDQDPSDVAPGVAGAQEPRSNERTAVYIAGPPPQEAAFLGRGLNAIASSGADYENADARALIFSSSDLVDLPARQQLVQWLRRNVEAAVNRGILCLVAVEAHEEADARRIVDNFGPSAKHVSVLPKDPGILAQTCLRHEPGPFPDAALAIEPPHNETLSEETRLLLARGFAGFQTLTMTRLTGGRSSVDGVWRVEAESSDRELRSPFVVKCGPNEHIDEQVNTYRDVVADRVPFRGCAPLCLERSLAGASRRLSVSRFVEDAQRLDDVVLAPGSRDIDALISSIYTGPLRRWRSDPSFRPLKLLPEFLDERSIPKLKERLRRTCRKLEAAGYTTLLSPGQMLRVLRLIPEMAVPVCRAHDDLNFRNVFVAHGPGDVVLIDFTRASIRPLSRDIARLDVGLAFDAELNSAQALPDDVLQDFFAHDLFAISLAHVVAGDSAGPRLRAIQTLRRRMIVEARSVGYDPALEYRVAVITELLYQAKRANHWGRLAYRCAEALVRTLPQPPAQEDSNGVAATVQSAAA